MIQLTLTLPDKEHKSKGKTVLEALENLDIDYTHIKTKGVITITDTKKVKGKEVKRIADKLFYLRPLRMLFANHLRRIGFARQLEALLESK